MKNPRPPSESSAKTRSRAGSVRLTSRALADKASKALAREHAFCLGAEMAASVADGYNASTSHPYLLGDCILAKLNIRKGKPRRNRLALRSEGDIEIVAMCLALAEVHRHSGNSTVVVTVMRDAEITLASARKAGVNPFDLRELKRAGVAAR